MKKNLIIIFFLIFPNAFFLFGKSFIYNGCLSKDSLNRESFRDYPFPRFMLGSQDEKDLSENPPKDAVDIENIIYHYHTDFVGSTSYLTNKTAEVAYHAEYIPYGEVFLEERDGEYFSPYLFNGKELDEESALYYYGARYYNPKTALWLSVDPESEKFSEYSPYNYTLNNPTKFIDPDGRFPMPPLTSDLNVLSDWIQTQRELTFTYGSKQVIEAFSGSTPQGSTVVFKGSLKRFKQSLDGQYGLIVYQPSSTGKISRFFAENTAKGMVSTLVGVLDLYNWINSLLGRTGNNPPPAPQGGFMAFARHAAAASASALSWAAGAASNTAGAVAGAASNTAGALAGAASNTAGAVAGAASNTAGALAAAASNTAGALAAAASNTAGALAAAASNGANATRNLATRWSGFFRRQEPPRGGGLPTRTTLFAQETVLPTLRSQEEVIPSFHNQHVVPPIFKTKPKSVFGKIRKVFH